LHDAVRRQPLSLSMLQVLSPFLGLIFAFSTGIGVLTHFLLLLLPFLQWDNFLLFTFVLYGVVYCCLCWVLNLTVHQELEFLLSDFHRLCSENFLCSFWFLCALRRGAISFPYCNLCCHCLSLVLSAQQWALICGCDSSYVSFCPLKKKTIERWEWCFLHVVVAQVSEGLGYQVPSVRLLRSWNPDLVCPSVEVLKLRSQIVKVK
jgi:hypothetical protein